MSNKNDHDTYIIPPNFIETGTFFGGMFRARNVIEAGILVFAIGMPVFLFLPSILSGGGYYIKKREDRFCSSILKVLEYLAPDEQQPSRLCYII